MLTLVVPAVESFDDVKQVFVEVEATTIQLEHSLLSLSKWESKHEKPFLSGDTKTTEEVFSYVSAMSLSGDLHPEVLNRLNDEHFLAINEYIEAKMTATWFNEQGQVASYNAPVVTAEVIYHWLVALNIPWEAERWHLNRLITLVKTINEKNKEASDTKKKAPTSQDLANRRALMDQRRRAAANHQEGSQT